MLVVTSPAVAVVVCPAGHVAEGISGSMTKSVLTNLPVGRWRLGLGRDLGAGRFDRHPGVTVAIGGVAQHLGHPAPAVLAAATSGAASGPSGAFAGVAATPSTSSVSWSLSTWAL